MAALDVPIVPEHVWEKVSDFSKFNNDKNFPIVGNGPFVLTDYKADSYVRLKAEQELLARRAQVRRAGLQVLQGPGRRGGRPAQGRGLLRRGPPALTPAQAASLKGEKDIKVNDAPGRRFYALATNPGAQAKDGKKFGDGDPVPAGPEGAPGALHGRSTARPSSTRSSRATPSRARATSRRASPRTSGSRRRARSSRTTPPKAAQLLDQAGYKKNADGKRVGKDGKPLDYRDPVPRHRPERQGGRAVPQGVVGKLGIGVTLDCLDNVTDPWLAGKYDLAFDGWSVNPDPDFVLSIHTCAALPATPKDTGATDNFICDKKYDELYARQLAEYDTGQAGRPRQADGVAAVRHRVHERHGVPERGRGLPHRPDQVDRDDAQGRRQHLRPGRLLELVVGGSGRPPAAPPAVQLDRRHHRGSPRASWSSPAPDSSSPCAAAPPPTTASSRCSPTAPDAAPPRSTRPPYRPRPVRRSADHGPAPPPRICAMGRARRAVPPSRCSPSSSPGSSCSG